jgi:uncharacterized membrane protein
MWTRAELKQRAKALLRLSYWESLIAVIITGVMTIGVSSLLALLPVLTGFGSLAATFFLYLPLSVGLSAFFLRCRLGPPVIKNVFFAFDGAHYMKIVGSMAWQYLFIFLWMLIPVFGITVVLVNWIAINIDHILGSPYYDIWHLLSSIGPGSLILLAVIYIAGAALVTIKRISYSMVPYILTDNPKIDYARALKLSIAMTYGYKWRIFVLYLSFLGWFLLGTLAFFVGNMFVMPYFYATDAELYIVLRDNALRNGLGTPYELNQPFPQ